MALPNFVDKTIGAIPGDVSPRPRYTLTDINGNAIGTSVALALENQVTVAGTPLNAAYLNQLVNGINNISPASIGALSTNRVRYGFTQIVISNLAAGAFTTLDITFTGGAMPSTPRIATNIQSVSNTALQFQIGATPASDNSGMTIIARNITSATIASYTLTISYVAISS